MTRNKLIEEVKKYFKLSELVCPHCVSTYGDSAWQFLSTELLSTIYILRTKVVNKPMIVNNGTTFTQRGLRCNRCDLVKSKTKPYMSSHCLGKGIDFHVSDMTAEEVRQLIKDNIDQFEYPIRLEEDVTWIHCDTYTLDSNKKLVTFKA